MKTRIITAVVALLIFIPVLIFANTTLIEVGNFNIRLINLAFALLSLVGVYESAKCVGEVKTLSFFPIYLVSFILPLLTYGDMGFYTPVFMFLLFYMLFVAVIKNKSVTSDKALVLLALTFYVTSSFGAMTVLYVTEIKFFPLIFIGAWVTDTFAYFSGYFFGKHKLIPAVSPKKTVEGAVGGSLVTTITFAIYAYFMAKDIKTALIFAVIGLVTSVVSQFGDLAASLVKRCYGIKDYGNLFPGHGGVLDRFDSILAVSAFLYITTLFINF